MYMSVNGCQVTVTESAALLRDVSLMGCDTGASGKMNAPSDVSACKTQNIINKALQYN